MKTIIYSVLVLLFAISCKGFDNQLNASDEVTEINLDFENSSHYPWEGQYNAGNFYTAEENGNKYGVFTLNENGDYWASPNTGISTARSEIQLFNTCKINRVTSYSFDFYIPDIYVESSDWQIICQFHDQPDTSIGESWSNYPSHSPPISVKYKNSSIVIAAYSWDLLHVIDIVSVPITKNTWNSLKLEILWSLNDNGYVKGWLNNAPITTADNKQVYQSRNCFNKASNYMKIGLYRSNSIMTKGIVYFDNVTSITQ